MMARFFKAVWAVCAVTAALLLSMGFAGPERAEANHYTCSHNHHWWLYNDWYHRLDEEYTDSIHGHVHVYDIQRVGEVRITQISWICNFA